MKFGSPNDIYIVTINYPPTGYNMKSQLTSCSWLGSRSARKAVCTAIASSWVRLPFRPGFFQASLQLLNFDDHFNPCQSLLLLLLFFFSVEESGQPTCAQRQGICKPLDQPCTVATYSCTNPCPGPGEHCCCFRLYV